MDLQKTVKAVDTCAYIECTNVRGGENSLHAFPKEDNPLHKEWISRVGNPLLHQYTASTIRRMGVCSKHFLPEMFKANPTLNTTRRKLLKKTAVPEFSSSRITPQEEEENGTQTDKPVRTYTRVPLIFSDNEESMEWLTIEPKTTSNQVQIENSAHKTLREMKLEEERAKLMQENRDLKAQLKRLKQKLIRVKRSGNTLRKKETADEFLDRHGCKSEVARTLVKLQLKGENVPYTSEERDLAKMLFYNSASAYNKLRKSGCHLPGESTVRKWISIYNFETGFSSDIFNEIKLRLSDLPVEQRLCALKWDEMSIKTWEEYSASLDRIEGLIDLGNLGRSDEKARYVFVFCVDSINAEKRWKQPLAYFLSGTGGIKSNEIIALLKICLTQLKECGARVKILTCDQCTTNQKVYKELGVTEKDPFFIHNSVTYYATFDFPHLIKRLVAQLRNHKDIYVGKESIISFTDMCETWNYDRTMNSSRLLPHITRIHLYPNAFQSMNVKRAFQVFGRRFAAAVEVAGRDPKGLMNTSETWKKTADFIKKLDKVIDYCNCYYLNDTFKKRPLCKRNNNVYNTLVDFIEWSTKWSLRPYQLEEIEDTRNRKITRPPCFNGLTITLRAFLYAYNSITEEEAVPDFQFAIGLANQDSVEHLFSKLRQRGGFNFNPTSRMVRLNLRHILCSKLIKTGDRTNTVIEDKEMHSLIGEQSSIPLQFNGIFNNDEEDKEDEGALGCATHFHNSNQDGNTNARMVEDISFYERTSITYFAGYIVHHIMKKYDCTECRDKMMKIPMDHIEAEEEYLVDREYSDDDEDAPSILKLSRATEEFIQVIQFQLEVYDDYWKSFWSSKNLLQNLCTRGIEKTNAQYPAWFKREESCYEHRVSALKHLYKVKIHDQARKRNEEEKSIKRLSKKRKLKNILHQ